MTILDPTAGSLSTKTTITNPDRGLNVSINIEGLPTTNLIPHLIHWEKTHMK